MQAVGDIAVLLVSLLLGGFALVILRDLFSGRINLRGLLTNENRRPSPARLQALVLNLAVAPLYLGAVALDGTTTALPEVPDALPIVLAGGNLFYLISKGSGGLGRRG